MRNRRLTIASAGALFALLFAALLVSDFLGWSRALSRPAAASTAATKTDTNFAHSSATTYSFLYTDATSVQFLTWTRNSGGSLIGSASDLQNLSPGNPNFISSTLAWTGTQVGDQITITIPGDEILATLRSSTLLRQQIDSQTGAALTQLWVAGTRQDYETLLTAFRAYTYLSQDLQGLTFEFETA